MKRRIIDICANIKGNDYSCNPIIYSATDCNSLKARDENFEHVINKTNKILNKI